jgi:hypothetical protein
MGLSPKKSLIPARCNTMPRGKAAFATRIEIESGINPLRQNERYPRPSKLTPVVQRPKPGYVLRVALRKTRLKAKNTLITNAMTTINLIGRAFHSALYGELRSILAISKSVIHESNAVVYIRAF